MCVLSVGCWALNVVCDVLFFGVCVVCGLLVLCAVFSVLLWCQMSCVQCLVSGVQLGVGSFGCVQCLILVRRIWCV